MRICKKKILTNIKNLKGLWFHIIGICCLIWFLIRVIPAPYRSQYPCQQISISIALGYIAFWSVLIHGLFIFTRKIKLKILSTVPSLITIFIIIFTITGIVFAGNNNFANIEFKSWEPIPKNPIGTPIGFNPGRVVWIWDPDATEKNQNGFWWEEQNNNQTIIDDMYSKGIQELTGQTSDYESWNAIFKFFNLNHGKGEIGYQLGEKISIKINMNNCWNILTNIIDGYFEKDNERDASPYVINSLLYQLVNVVGVNEQDITVYDTSRRIQNWFYDRVSINFPDVHFNDCTGGAIGREKYQTSAEKIYFSDGLIRTLPKCVVDANYIINMPLLKKHVINNGVTLSGKNMFGTFIEPVVDLHPYHESGQIIGNPTPQTDLIGHEEIGKKTLIYIGDGTYGTLQDHRTISKFDMYPFNDDWSNSLFFSQDPIALDSVMYDFLHYEGPSPIEGSQNYLHQSAEIIKETYDPENDGEFLSESLGVHEHWDISTPIFSSNRYVGSENQGIEYIAIGFEKANSSIVITQPKENKFYLNGIEKSFKILWKDIYKIPITLIIGNITVKTQLNNIIENIDKINFYIDGNLQYSDEEYPYEWNWNKPSFSKKSLKISATVNGEEIIHSQRIVWKFF